MNFLYAWTNFIGRDATVRHATSPTLPNCTSSYLPHISLTSTFRAQQAITNLTCYNSQYNQEFHREFGYVAQATF